MELNREQIIKALECCGSQNLSDCRGCPYEPEVKCHRLAITNALALIKAQAEDYTALDEQYRMLYEENERRRDQLCQLNARIYELQLELETAKGQAINQFAERVKKYYSTLGGSTNSTLVAYHIDQIAKEIIGETK